MLFLVTVDWWVLHGSTTCRDDITVHHRLQHDSCERCAYCLIVPFQWRVIHWHLKKWLITYVPCIRFRNLSPAHVVTNQMGSFGLTTKKQEGEWSRQGVQNQHKRHGLHLHPHSSAFFLYIHTHTHTEHRSTHTAHTHTHAFPFIQTQTRWSYWNIQKLCSLWYF